MGTRSPFDLDTCHVAFIPSQLGRKAMLLAAALDLCITSTELRRTSSKRLPSSKCKFAAPGACEPPGGLQTAVSEGAAPARKLWSEVARVRGLSLAKHAAPSWRCSCRRGAASSAARAGSSRAVGECLAVQRRVAS